ncbi:MAG: hypothetical protein MUC45_12875 [Actinomycetia bacterium]|jgi:hypothetical protein|nr:hypothetical protein [Actinomycetes bacterium]
MTRRRTAPLVGLSALAVLALSGCEQPTPGVTAWSGRTSEHTEAVCWSRDAATKVDAEACAQAAKQDTVPRIEVVPGSTVGISVDPELAEKGWFPTIGDSRLTVDPVTRTYYRFALSEQNLSTDLELRVLALGEDTATVRGLWVFQLTRAG